MSQSATVFEDVLNVRLAKLLSQQGLKTKAEHQIGKHRIDVKIDLPGNITVALEAEQGQNKTKRQQALKEATGRLGLPQINSAVAVCYPPLSDENDLDESTQLSVRPVTAENWETCDLSGLVSVIRKIPQEIGNPDASALLLEEKIKSAVDSLSDKQHTDIAAALGLPPGKDKGWKERATQRGLLVIIAASMFHARLDNENLEAPQVDERTGQPFRGSWPHDKLQTCLASQSATQSLKKAWDLILAVDYKPVFETAIAVLDAPAYNSDWEDAVKLVAEAALHISGNIESLRHDLMGRLFHLLLPDAKHDGSYYTSTAAATLLAGLAIAGNTSSGQEKQPEEMRIVDPACGTGTLLMASAERMQDINPGGHSTALGKVLLEDVLHGYDINLPATHMAATTLGLLSPNIKFKNMNIYETLFGVRNGAAYIGSLELYTGTAQHSNLSSRLGYLPAPTRQIDEGDGSDTLHLTKHDLVIMNPPYTRDSRRYDQLSDADENAMKSREEEVFGDEPVHRVSLGAMFMLLSDKLANEKTGSVASVLPLTAASAPNASVMWEHLLDRFWVEIVVVSHDPQRFWFSENTDISEMLIVLRRRPESYGEIPPPAKILRLGQNPSLPTQTVPIYDAHHKDKLANLPNSTLWEWPQEKLRANDWTPVKFYSNFLVQTVLDWFEGGQIPTQPLGDIAEVGPAGQGVRGVFAKGAAPSSTLGAKAIWNNNTQDTYTMIAEPVIDIKPQAGKKNLARAKKMWDRRGHLFIPVGLSTTSMLLGAVWSNDPILGARWVTVKPKGQMSETEVERWTKAVCVWLNSSPGMLATLSNSTPKKLVYPQMSIDGQRNIPIPAFSTEQINQLASTFDCQKDTRQQPLREPNATGRVALDDAVSSVLGIDVNIVKQVRAALSKEPAITNAQYTP